MDFWVVAAAAGAGCLAKYWQHHSTDRKNLTAFSSGDSYLKKPESPGHPFHRLAQRKKLDDVVSIDRRWASEGRLSDMCQPDDTSVSEVASTSGFDGQKSGYFEEHEDCNVLPVSTISPECSKNEDRDHEAGDRPSDDTSDSSVNSLPDQMGSFRASSRNTSSLIAKRLYGNSLEPLNSLERCLKAQQYKEHAELKDYLFNSLPSPTTPTVRRLSVSGGSQVLSEANGDVFSTQTGFLGDKMNKDACLEKYQNVCGIPSLPEIRSLNIPKEMKRTGKAQNGRLSSSTKMFSGKHVNLQDGSPDFMILFCLGISIGIMSSFITSKREVDKLKGLLKQAENLVQDLQEELEMKDSMTVKELATENHESACDDSNDRTLTEFSSQLHVDISTKSNGEILHDEKSVENLESISKIEAELEAELERLELNINASSLDGKLSDLIEVDPDFIADFAQGELRANKIHGRAVGEPSSSGDARDTYTPQSWNYAVSPRELSLRLHEVLQSRLEERVQELETALQNSQTKLTLMESGRKNSWKEFSSSPWGYSSNPGNSSAKECNPEARSLVMNLSGEALDAWNEDYIELTKTDNSEDPDLVLRHESEHQEGFDRDSIMRENGVGGSKPNLTIDLDSLSCNSRRTTFDTLEVRGLDDICVSEDESSDWDTEIENQLIKKIVDRTKKGSPVVLNAQRLLFTMGEK